MNPPEEGEDRFRDKEDKDTPLPILPSGIYGITVMEAYISTLRREGIAVDEDNYPAPENFMHSDDVFNTSSSITFVFHGINTWRQSGNFPVLSYKLKMTPNPRIQHMSCLNLFVKLYFMEYIKDVVIPDTNKHLNLDMNFREYFHVIGFHLIMDFYVGHSLRDFFLKDLVTPQKGAPIRLNHIVSWRRL